jgi:ABC-type antimicrobial peptide transport system permease subunit
MNGNQHLWRLISRKLAGEASPEELAELQFLAQEDPQLQSLMDTLEGLWKPARKPDGPQLEQAWQRHAKRLKRRTRKNKKTQRSQLFNSAILGSYLKVIARNLLRLKEFSWINITGLAIGMASAILILLWIQNDLSFDRFNKKRDRIYVLYTRSTNDGRIECFSGVPTLLTPLLQTTYPQVEDVCRINGAAPLVLNLGDRSFEADGIMADHGLLTIFSFPLVRGNIQEALNSPRSMVITEKFAKKLFPDGRDALGQVIRIDSNAFFRIEGVLKDLPTTSSLSFEYVIPYSYMKEIGWYKPSWIDEYTRTYISLKPGVAMASVNGMLKNVIKTHARSTNEVFLYPYSRYHLYGNFENGKEVEGSIEYVHLFAIIAGFILLVACINYMNLSTARSVKKTKEIGIRKVVGAGKGSIIIRFLGESILISFIAGCIAIFIAQLTIKEFSWLTWEDLQIPYGDPRFWMAFMAFVLFTGGIAGSYPAFYLSTYRPISVLKGSYKTAYNGVGIRKALVVFQFSIAIVFIICTTVVYRQINYAGKRDPGYNRDHLAFAYIKGQANTEYPLIKHDLLSSGAATAVTRSNSPITYIWSESNEYKWPGADRGKKIHFNEFHADDDFIETMGLKLLAGRTINTNAHPTDSTAVLLSQSAVTAMGLKDPIGRTISNGQGNWTVVGVVKDFVSGSPFFSARPVIIQGPKNWFGAVTFRLNTQHSLADNMKTIAAIFRKYNPGYPFISRFVDEADAEKFGDELRTGIRSALFGGLAILISCLGLFALSAYMAENRVKEIGVRKVLGATVFSVWRLLSKDFVWLVVIAFAIASPVAYFLMHSWIRNYEYRTGLPWYIFAAAGAGALGITLLTVSFQAVKAALANPVKSLRSE